MLIEEKKETNTYISKYKEIQKYLKESLKHRNDTIKYWKENSIKYPTLYSIVRNVLSVASSSVEIERTFSGAKLLVTDNRSNLGWERIEQCVLLREWANFSRVDIVENSVIYNYSNISKMV
ncbi:hypothetical protein DICPUDRAFT_75126 [Dictyostelium purpureum]|uniref:HAT C-terminal dimerisation domain-containing protein n=1 Tax=Dictyostelium purpureum TaxID=5786 RepID=F0Z9R1_DICPU|nr:uncharacterized protein DICPUDRAFT_75126 [Dictyostelium purpureum]EGC39344.1 hypothetical protein DICPUDRAFT_75126 [Dictyostelium purpureum]|eukprot:XP_003284132.1 hypothetical protein DICPUDRAFT_75126 [Dictyostelium purpureum]